MSRMRYVDDERFAVLSKIEPSHRRATSHNGEALKIGDEIVFATEDDPDVYVITYISANYVNAIELKQNPGALYLASRFVLRPASA